MGYVIVVDCWFLFWFVGDVGVSVIGGKIYGVIIVRWNLDEMVLGIGCIGLFGRDYLLIVWIF